MASAARGPYISDALPHLKRTRSPDEPGSCHQNVTNLDLKGIGESITVA